jgi:hypothetical protein
MLSPSAKPPKFGYRLFEQLKETRPAEGHQSAVYHQTTLTQQSVSLKKTVKIKEQSQKMEIYIFSDFNPPKSAGVLI